MRVGHWANHPIPENIAITETIDTKANTHYLGEAVVSNIGRERTGNMTTLGEVRREAQRPNTPLVNPRTKFYIGNWNVRTMFASGKAAQIAREMRLADIEILGISESRWSGSGRMRLSTGETVIYSGRDDDIHQQGVAIMMSKSAAASLINWSPVNEGIISARFYSRHIKLTVIHAYAPTNEADEDDKERFYGELTDVEKAHRHDMLIITGDMNAKIGNTPEPYEGIMGRHGVGMRNDNGERLCDFCAMNNLVITGTLFPHKDIHKTTWVSPDGNTRNQIDHTLVNRKFRTSIRDTRVYRGADIASDHILVKTSVKLKLKKVTTTERRRVKFDTDKMKRDEVKKRFCLKLKNRFQILEQEEVEHQDEDDDSLERMNTIMEKAFTETAKEELGLKKWTTKPWISQTAWDLIDHRKNIKMKMDGVRSERLKQKQRDDYREKDKEVKKQIKKDKKEWMENIAKEAEDAARHQNMRALYGLTKVLSNERPKQNAAIKDKDGNLLTESEERKRRWKEHFSEILNREAPENPVTEEDVVMQEIAEISVDPPTTAEIKSAIRRLKNGKAAGDDLIVAELLKADVDFTTEKVKQLLDNIWQQEKIPDRWRKGLIVKFSKTGDLKNCKNWRGVTLLPVVSKVLGRILIDRIKSGVDNRLRKEQAGYRSGRGTTDQVFILRNIIEQSHEWQSSLYLNFIDFEKAFDSVHRDSLWIIMKAYGIPLKIVELVKALYSNFECAVIEESE